MIVKGIIIYLVLTTLVLMANHGAHRKPTPMPPHRERCPDNVAREDFAKWERELEEAGH